MELLNGKTSFQYKGDYYLFYDYFRIGVTYEEKVERDIEGAKKTVQNQPFGVCGRKTNE